MGCRKRVLALTMSKEDFYPCSIIARPQPACPRTLQTPLLIPTPRENYTLSDLTPPIQHTPPHPHQSTPPASNPPTPTNPNNPHHRAKTNQSRTPRSRSRTPSPSPPCPCRTPTAWQSASSARSSHRNWAPTARARCSGIRTARSRHWWRASAARRRCAG